MGDFNARIPDLRLFTSTALKLGYTENPDTKSNSNGVDLVNICLSNYLKPLNHAVHNSKVFDGGLTYKQKDRWVSQLDWTLA